jgi:hypothetical protein
METFLDDARIVAALPRTEVKNLTRQYQKIYDRLRYTNNCNRLNKLMKSRRFLGCDFNRFLDSEMR